MFQIIPYLNPITGHFTCIYCDVASVSHGLLQATDCLWSADIRRGSPGNYTVQGLKDRFGDQLEGLFSRLPSDTFDKVVEFTTHAQLAQHESTKRRHIEKFSRLKIKSRADLDQDWRKREEDITPADRSKWVKNLSDRSLSEAEVTLLSKGLNYTVTPRDTRVVDIVTVTESVVKQANIPATEAEELRGRVCNILRNAKQPPRISIERNKKHLVACQRIRTL